MKSTHICITRHGETDWNKQGILQGWIDVPINDHGRDQAIELASRLSKEGFTQVWTSPLIRARETAELIATALQLPLPGCHKGLKERHFGAIQGIPKKRLAELDPAQFEQILRRNPATEFFGGESMDEFADRVIAALVDIAAHECGTRVLVITHGWVLDVVSRHIQGLERHVVLNVKPKNGESVWIEVMQGVISAMSDEDCVLSADRFAVNADV